MANKCPNNQNIHEYGGGAYNTVIHTLPFA